MPLLVQGKIRPCDWVVEVFPVHSGRELGNGMIRFTSDHRVQLLLTYITRKCIPRSPSERGMLVGDRKRSIEVMPCSGGIRGYEAKSYVRDAQLINPKNCLGKMLGKPPADPYEMSCYLKRVASYYHSVLYDIASKDWFDDFQKREDA